MGAGHIVQEHDIGKQKIVQMTFVAGDEDQGGFGIFVPHAVYFILVHHKAFKYIAEHQFSTRRAKLITRKL